MCADRSKVQRRVMILIVCAGLAVSRNWLALFPSTLREREGGHLFAIRRLMYSTRGWRKRCTSLSGLHVKRLTVRPDHDMISIFVVCGSQSIGFVILVCAEDHNRRIVLAVPLQHRRVG